jgi:hypothetical protein
VEVMQIKYSPQRSDETIVYSYAGDVITCTYGGATDTFDFSGLPDGEAGKVETTLAVNPIVSAKRVNGELRIELLYFHGPDASQEVLFPNWQEVGNDGEN